MNGTIIFLLPLRFFLFFLSIRLYSEYKALERFRPSPYCRLAAVGRVCAPRRPLNVAALIEYNKNGQLIGIVVRMQTLVARIKCLKNKNK